MKSNYKNLIILGNGFDLHLGLPTRWSDIVEFYEIVINENQKNNILLKEKIWSFVEFKRNKSRWLAAEDIRACIKAILNNIEDENDKKIFSNRISYFFEKIKNCKMLSLLSYFRQNNNSYLNFKWSDFEHLVENILDSVDEYVENLLNKSYTAETSAFMNNLLRRTIDKISYKDNEYFNTKFFVGNFNLKSNVVDSKNRFLDYLFNELIEFTLIYKEYIDLIVDRIIQMNLNNNISTKYSLILTFNYTQDVVLFNNFYYDTFYVHGNTSNNIIIGISNEQKKEDRIKFSKNYMRVYNRVQNTKNEDYTNQISTLISENSFLNYYFIGHSIDKIDHSFLKKLYENGRQTRTTIFYYSEADKNNKIFNLYLMLGEDYITQMLNHDKLEFVKFDKLENYSFK